MSATASRGLFLAALAAALLFRLPGLSLRPMHHDEANQAVKFGALLEKGEYAYDKTDHHGPTLYYATLSAAAARGQKTLADLDEKTLRLVPVVFGVGLLFLFFSFGRSLLPAAGALAALLAAFSPAMTYYSRFYIQESLFAFFALALLVSLWRYAERLTLGWALSAGLSAGLMFATKETSVIVFAALAVSLPLAFRLRDRTALGRGVRLRADGEHIVFAVLAMLITAAVLYSSLGRHPSGPVDAVTAFKSYFLKAGAPDLHAHPWFYYLNLLAYWKSGGLVWSEGFILVLAAVGMIATAAGRTEREAEPRLGFLLLFFTLFMTAVFFAIPYKTPWNLLAFYSGWLLFAGIGGAFLLRIIPFRTGKALALAALVAGFAHLAVQNHRANVTYPADTRNPYVYAQTSPDFLKLVKRVEDLLRFDSAKTGLTVAVVAAPSEQWPLPWYLRAHPRVGYWPEIPPDGWAERAALVIASAEKVAALESRLGDGYQAEHYGLREGEILTLFIPNALWDRFINRM